VAQISVKTNPESGSVLGGNQQPCYTTRWEELPQDGFTEADYDNDELDRFLSWAGFPGQSSADWGWVQHMHASLNDKGRAAVVLDTVAVSRGSGNAGTNKKKTDRQWLADQVKTSRGKSKYVFGGDVSLDFIGSA